MTTSGTTTFSPNRDELIKSALRKVSAIESGETPGDDDIGDASDALNTMIKHWQGSGIHIWTTQEAILFPEIDQVRYTLGSSSSDRVTAVDVETTLASAALVGASTVVLDDVAGVATGYNIGVQLDDGTFHWTTVNGAPSGSTVTLTAVLTDSAAADNLVLVYQTELVRPLKIISARRHNLISGIDTPIDEFDRQEYFDLPNKTSSGAINGFYYDRRGGANSTGYLYLWQAPSSVEDIVKMTVAREIEDFTVAGDDADLPKEWIRAIVWGLADEIADEYDVPEPKRSRIERRAAQYLNEANWWEKELVAIEFVPDRRA